MPNYLQPLLVDLLSLLLDLLFLQKPLCICVVRVLRLAGPPQEDTCGCPLGCGPGGGVQVIEGEGGGCR
jgi:hypothetical protein